MGWGRFSCNFQTFVLLLFMFLVMCSYIVLFDCSIILLINLTYCDDLCIFCFLFLLFVMLSAAGLLCIVLHCFCTDVVVTIVFFLSILFTLLVLRFLLIFASSLHASSCYFVRSSFYKIVCVVRSFCLPAPARKPSHLSERRGLAPEDGTNASA